MKGILTSSGSTVKGLVGTHPIALGVVAGIGAYFIINKYLLNKDMEDETTDTEEESELIEE